MNIRPGVASLSRDDSQSVLLDEAYTPENLKERGAIDQAPKRGPGWPSGRR